MRNAGGTSTTIGAVSVEGAFELATPGCEGALQPQGECSLEVRLPASEGLGPATGLLRLTYSSSEGQQTSSTSLSANVSGFTANLIVNGTFEDCEDDDPMEPPPATPVGWVNAGPKGNTWACQTSAGPIVPIEADTMLGAFVGAGGEHRLEQIVELPADLSPGGTAEFRIDAVTLAVDNDPYRVVIEYLDGRGMVLDAFDSNWVSDDSQQWVEVADTRPMPEAAGSVVVTLRCDLRSGNNCDAFFDDASLRVGY